MTTPEYDQDDALFAALFGATDPPPVDHQEAAMTAVVHRSESPKRPNSLSLADALARRRHAGGRVGADASSVDKEELMKMLGVQPLGTEPVYDAEDCTQLNLPEFTGLGGRKEGPYSLHRTSGSFALAVGSALQVDVSAACSNDEEAASAYLGLWIQPRHDVPFHDVVVTAHLIGESHGTTTGRESKNDARLTMEVGTVRVPTRHVRPGYHSTARREYILPTPPRTMAARVPESLSMRFRAQPHVFHYIFVGAHVRAATQWSRACFEDLDGPNGPGGPGGLGGMEEPRAELGDISSAGAAINLAVCAVDVAYEPLVLPDEIERLRHERLHEEVRTALGSHRDG